MPGTKRVLQTIEAHWSRHTVIGRRYVLDSLLGRGGHGEVWRAEDLAQPGTYVALKRLLQNTVSEESQRRLRAEMTALHRLGHHNHIVTLRNYGEEHGQLYLVLDYVPGQTLDNILGNWRQGQGAARPPLDSVRYVMECLCLALHHVHVHGIVHRDVKPGNVLVSVEDKSLRIRLCDFGIARCSSTSLTQPGERLGTDDYMSPEQATGAWSQLGPASDLFSLAVLAIELLTLRATSPLGTPFANFVVNHWNQVPGYLYHQNPALPAKLVSLLVLSLSPRIEARPRSALDMLQELRLALSTGEHFV